MSSFRSWSCLMNLPESRLADWDFGTDWRPFGAEQTARTTGYGFDEPSNESLNESEANAMSNGPQIYAADFKTKDSGERRSFSTGSVRDVATGKPSYRSLDPRFIRRMAQLMARGAEKYGMDNWRKGQPISDVLDSLQRHLASVQLCETDEDHEAAVAVNMMFVSVYLMDIAEGRLPPDLDDRPRNGVVSPSHRAGYPIMSLKGSLRDDEA
jgi:hypothetical protein